MRLEQINNEVARSWSRDLELLELTDGANGFSLRLKSKNDLESIIKFNDLISYKVTGENFFFNEEFSKAVEEIKSDNLRSWFFFATDSKWLRETESIIGSEYKHFLLFTYDYIIEVIAKDFKISE